MSNELACTWLEFQQRCKEFIDVLPDIKNFEELDGAWSAIALGYLNLDCTKLEAHQAALLLQILGRERIWHEVKLQALWERS